MTISVTAYTAVAGKTSQSITNISGSAGDLLVIYALGDVGNCSIPTLSDTSLCRTLMESEEESYNDSYVYGVPFHKSVSSLTVTLNNGSYPTCLAAYVISGLGKAITPGSLTCNYSDSGLYNGSYTRAGIFYQTMQAGTITSAKMDLKKSGSPTGTAYLRVRDISDDSIIGTLGSVDVSTLTTTPTAITFNTTPVVVTGPSVICIEYTGGDVDNAIYDCRSYDTSQMWRAFYRYQTSVVIKDIGYYKPNIYDITGVNFLGYIDQCVTAGGSSTTPSATSGTLAQANELAIGFVARESIIDSMSWATGATYTDQNQRSAGTTGGGDAENQSIYTATKTVSSTSAVTSQMSGDSAGWNDIIMTLYGGLGTETDDSQSAYLEGGGTDTDNQSAYLSGKDTDLDSQSAFLGGKDTSLDSQSAYTEGYSSNSDNQSAFLEGQNASNTSQSAYLESIGQILVPNSDYIDGNWINESSGTVLYSSLTEENDDTYIWLDEGQEGDSCMVHLTPPDGVTSEGRHFLRWRLFRKADDGYPFVRVAIYCGETLVFSTVTGIPQNPPGKVYEFCTELTPTHIDNITDYSNLYAKVELWTVGT